MAADRTDAPVEATVLVPTMAGRGPLLEYAVASVLAQTVTNLEVFIVGDGVDDPTRETIARLRRDDDRVRFFDHEKHERRGEPNRHRDLAEARGRIVCYLTDRDLMLPLHVEIMSVLLKEAEFAHTLISAIAPHGPLLFRAGINLGEAADREWILRESCSENSIPLSFAGHTLDMYRRLPHGWRQTPEGVGTDAYMWEQFLAQSDCRAVSGTVPTILYLPRYWRRDWTVERREEELRTWWERMQAPDWRVRHSQYVITGLMEERIRYGRHLRQLGAEFSRIAEVYNSFTGQR